jgi:thiamine transport system substrate-binding protein
MVRRVVLAIVAIVAIACALSLAAVPSSASTARGKTNGETIRLVTHDSFAVSNDVLDAFTAKTGIEVEVLQGGDGGAIVNQAVLTKDNPVGDVLYGVDNTFLTRALDEGIFERYRSPALDTVPQALRLDSKARVTPIDYADVCINYDKAWFESHHVKVPRTLEDLTKPAYKGRLVVEDPSTSTTGLAFLVATVAEYGPKRWQQYWERLRANDVQVVDGWDQAFYDEFSGGGAGGSRPLVVSYASSPPASVFFSEPPTDEATIGTMTGACFRQVEFAGILAGTEHRAAARTFVDFMLSEQFQADMPLQMFVFPAREGTPLPKVFEQFSDLPENPYTLSPTKIGAGRDEWIREWTGTVLR